MADPGPSRKPTPQLSGDRFETEVVRRSPEWKAAPITDVALALAAEAAFAAAPPSDAEAYELTVVLSDDKEVRDLNRTWRGKDTPTNVLSFPAGEQPGAPRQLGELVLAFETVAREADAQGLALSEHISHLVVHGVLHLLGFDHASEDDAEKMESTERQVLASLGIADPYAEKGHAGVAEVSP